MSSNRQHDPSPLSDRPVASTHRHPELLDPCDERACVRAVLEDWLDLQRHLVLDPRAARALLCEFGEPAAALSRAPAAEAHFPLEPAAARRVLERCGARALPFLSPAYPDRLARLEDAPPLLLLRGDAAVLRERSVAIVGSRAATAYGLAAARDFGRELARAGLVVVSGLAYGIDAAAHTGALEAGGRSVAVQACGIDIVYPSVHAALAAKVADSGAVISEFPPETRPRKAFFPHRNRLISGLAEAVIVVEARERSGSLVTARHAANQGIDVFAVPGPIYAPTSAGTHRLLRDGAWIASAPRDVLEVLDISAASPRERAVLANVMEKRRVRILEALAHHSASRDELSRRLEVAPEQLALDLLELELEGRVVEDRDGRLCVLRGPNR